MLVAANAAGAELSWRGSSDCRRELEVAEQIESMTGRRLRDVDLADFELEPEPSAEGQRLTLTTITRASGERSSRVFEGKTCVDVTDAAAVAIALTIGSGPVAPEPSSSPGPAPSSSPNTAKSLRNPAPVPPATPPWRFSGAASVVVDSSVTPNPVAGGSLRLALGKPYFRFELEGTAFAPSKQLDGDGRGGTFQLAVVAPLACLVREVGAPSLLACAGYEIGSLSAVGEGVTEPFDRTTLWQAGRAELGLLWPLSASVAIGGRLGGAVALTRRTFVLDNPTAVHRPPLLSGRLALGVEVRL